MRFHKALGERLRMVIWLEIVCWIITKAAAPKRASTELRVELEGSTHLL